jgi:glucose/arabinose dehydrogenase
VGGNRNGRVALPLLLAVAAAACGGASEATIDAPATTPVPVNTVPFDTPTADTATPAAPTNEQPTGSVPASEAPEQDAATSTTTTSTTTTTTTLPPDAPPTNSQFDGLEFDLEFVSDVNKPTAVAWRSEDNAMYISTQPGPIYRLLDDETTVVVDLTAETFEDLPGSERGILGLAFDPRDRRMFVNYTDTEQDTRVISFELDGGVVIADSRREVLFIDQPAVGHNGGRMLFDDAGNLYIGSGDGGGSNGRDAQDTTKLLGAILRITPNLDGDGYQIPADNPFADGNPQAGTDRPEVWARGFRNPWTFSLDDETGDLWIGDVGNSEFEEISVMRGGTSGLNFGWYWYEGNNRRRDDAPDGMVPPVYDYPHSQGVAVMGGHVYRGEDIPELRGAYLFGDLTGPIWAIGEQGVSRLTAPNVNTMTGWAEDPSGELYILSLYDGVARFVPAS